MPDRRDTPRDLAWYQDRWEELMDLLPTSEPNEVVDQVRELQISILDEEAEALDEMGLTDAEEAKTVLQRIFGRLQRLRRENQALQHLQEAVGADSPDEVTASIEELRERVQTLEEQQEVLAEAGFDRPEHAIQALASMEEQLDELYNEKEATERSALDTDFELEGDTFDQLQALMAREEKLQRELGVSSPGDVIEMVEGLSDQVEDIYRTRDDENATDSIFTPPTEQSSAPRAPSVQRSSIANRLEKELGVSDPDTLIEMVNDLTEQLDVLYEGNQRLAELNLNGADDAIAMVRSMQRQLESLYERQDQMSEHGISGVDHALSMIDSMEAQLNELYDERQRLTEKGMETPDELVSRLDELEQKMDDLLDEKKALRDKRDRLQSQFDELEAQIGMGDPEAISDLIDSLEAQLEEVYDDQERSNQPTTPPSDEPLLPLETGAQLHTLDDDDLDALPVGVFCVDDKGVIRRVNTNVQEWPGVEVEDPSLLVGESFFSEVAPAANNALFRGRFEAGVAEGRMDERFFYTYISEQAAPTNLDVQLYRTPDEAVNWIAFRIL